MLLTGMFPADVRARYVGIVYHAGAALAALVPTATAELAVWAHVRLATSLALVAGSCEVVLALTVLAGRRLSAAKASPAPESPALEVA